MEEKKKNPALRKPPSILDKRSHTCTTTTNTEIGWGVGGGQHVKENTKEICSNKTKYRNGSSKMHLGTDVHAYYQNANLDICHISDTVREKEQKIV